MRLYSKPLQFSRSVWEFIPPADDRHALVFPTP